MIGALVAIFGLFEESAASRRARLRHAAIKAHAAAVARQARIVAAEARQRAQEAAEADRRFDARREAGRAARLAQRLPSPRPVGIRRRRREVAAQVARILEV